MNTFAIVEQSRYCEPPLDHVRNVSDICSSYKLLRSNLDPFHHHIDLELWRALEKCHIKDTVRSLSSSQGSGSSIYEFLKHVFNMNEENDNENITSLKYIAHINLYMGE